MNITTKLLPFKQFFDNKGLEELKEETLKYNETNFFPDTAQICGVNFKDKEFYDAFALSFISFVHFLIWCVS